MGFLDHLFKLKPNDEKAGNGTKGGNGATADAVPDPGAFLHPKYFVTRGLGGLSPAAPVTRTAERPPLPETHAQEIVLTLGDVLSRIPTPLLRAGLHDATRELRFAIGDLSADIARGRAALPLSKIAALCPDVFAREIGADDDTEIRLPLQKLVQQIALLRGPPPEPVAAETALAKDAPAAARDPEPAVTAEIAVPEPPPALVPVAPASTSPAVHFRPPPIVRPVLVQPPPILAAAEHRAERAASEPTLRTALQTLFTTDEPLDLAAVCCCSAALPGVRACAIDLRGEQALAGDAPAGFDHAALRAAAARLPPTEALPLGALESVTLHGEQAAISIFTPPGLLLAVLHHELSPGTRERLATIARALAQAS